jgi:DNA adenine methylase
MEEEKHLSPPLCRVGSKKRFAELLTHILPPHTTYVEPFAGSAAIFFYKKPAQREVLNDLDKNVTGIFKTIQKVSGDAVFPNIDTMAKAQEYHTHTYTKPEDILTQYLIRSCSGWMGKTVPEGNKLMRLQNPLGRLKNIKAYKARLRGVHITNEDYEKVIKDNDSASTVFFMDPPYESSIGLTYAKGSNRFDFERFAKVVSGIKGKWLITINDSPFIRGLFKAFNVTPVLIIGHHNKTGHANTTKTIGTNDRPELLISNFPLPRDVSEFAPKSLKFRRGGVGEAKKERERLEAEDAMREADWAKQRAERTAMGEEDASALKRRGEIRWRGNELGEAETEYLKAEAKQKQGVYLTLGDKKKLKTTGDRMIAVLKWFSANLDDGEKERIYSKKDAVDGVWGEAMLQRNLKILMDNQKARGWGN